MAVDTCTCNCQWNLKNIKRIVLVSCAFATLQTVVFMRLPLCGCVDCVAVCFVGCFYFWEMLYLLILSIVFFFKIIVKRFYCICRNNGWSDRWACEMAVDTCTCNCQWNLNSFLSWRPYKNHKVSSTGSSYLARFQTFVFVRLPCCDCVDVHGCFVCCLK